MKQHPQCVSFWGIYLNSYKRLTKYQIEKKNYFAQISCKHVNMKSHVNIFLIIEILKRHLDDG